MSNEQSSLHTPSAAAALLFPLAIVGSWYAYFAGQSDSYEPSSLAIEMEAELEEATPEVVVLGNSASFHGVDPELLAKKMGIDGQVTRLFVPASRSPAWYAMLKNRILSRQDKPELVLVVASLHHMLDLEMNTQRIERLRGQLRADDALIEERVLGGASWPVLDASRGATDVFFEVPKQAAVGLLFDDGEGGPDEALLDRGQRISDAASEVVFDLESGTDMSLHRRVLPVAQIDVEAGRGKGAPPLDPERSFLGDLADLAAENDVRLAFVWFPLPASNPAPRPGVELQRATIEKVTEKGAGWIDLHTLPLSPSVFFDHIHMNEAGRRQFTEALAEALLEIDALGSGPMKAPPLPLNIGEMRRVGTPSSLPAPGKPRATSDPCRFLFPASELTFLNNRGLYEVLQIAEGSPVRLLADGVPLTPHVKAEEQDCDGTFVHGPTGILFSPEGGKVDEVTWTLAWDDAAPSRIKRQGTPSDAWWVYPGTDVRIEFPEPWDPSRGAFAVRVDATILGDSGTYDMIVGQDVAPLEVTGTLARGLVTPEAPTGPWSVEISAPHGSPPLFLQRITVGSGPGATTVLGSFSGGASTRVLGSAHPSRTIVTDSPLPEGSGVMTPRRIEAPGDVPVARMKLGKLNGLGPGEVYSATTVGGCSPVRVLEDGSPLPHVNPPLLEVRNGKLGAYRVQGGSVMFTTSDGTDPVTNGRTYEAVLEPDRACGQAAWIYPGDAVRIELDPARLSPLGARTLELSAATFLTPPQGKHLTVTVEADGEQHLQTKVSLATLSTGFAEVELDRPIPGDAKRLVMTLSSTPRDPYVLVTSANLATVDTLKAAPSSPAVGSTPPKPSAAPSTLDAPLVLPLKGIGTLKSDPGHAVWFGGHEGGSGAEIVTSDDGQVVRLTSRVFAAHRLCSQYFPASGAGTARADVLASPVEVDPSVRYAGLRLEVIWRDASGKAFSDVQEPVFVKPSDTSRWVNLKLHPPANAATGQLCLRFARAKGTADLRAWKVVPGK